MSMISQMSTKPPSPGEHHSGPSSPFRNPSPGHPILILLSAVVLFYGVVYPNAQTLLSSLQIDGKWSLATYREVLTQGIVIESVLTSLGISLLTVTCCVLVGVPLAFLLDRKSTRLNSSHLVIS